VLRFAAERARWVADGQLYPQPSGSFRDDGRYEMQVPYADPRELIMDILKFGAGVEVMTVRKREGASPDEQAPAQGESRTRLYLTDARKASIHEPLQLFTPATKRH